MPNNSPQIITPNIFSCFARLSHAWSWLRCCGLVRSELRTCSLYLPPSCRQSASQLISTFLSPHINFTPLTRHSPLSCSSSVLSSTINSVFLSKKHKNSIAIQSLNWSNLVATEIIGLEQSNK